MVIKFCFSEVSLNFTCDKFVTYYFRKKRQTFEGFKDLESVTDIGNMYTVFFHELFYICPVNKQINPMPWDRLVTDRISSQLDVLKESVINYTLTCVTNFLFVHHFDMSCTSYLTKTTK